MATLQAYFAKPLTGEWGNDATGPEDGVPVLRTTNFTEDGRLSYDDLAYRAIDLEKKQEKILQPGDIIIEKSGGTPKKPVGRCAYFDREDGQDYFCNNFTAILRTKTEEVNSKYLWYILQEHYKTRQCLKYQYKTNGIANLDIKDYFQHIPVALPSREIQDQRVAAMDECQHLIDVGQRILSTLDEMVKAQFIELFGNPALNPEGWPVKKLTGLGSCKNGMNFGRNDEGYDIRCLGVSDFKDLSIIDDVESLPMVSLNDKPPMEYMLQDGDIVFVRSNGNKDLVGRCVAIYPGDVPVTYSGFCIRFRNKSNDIRTGYLLRFLKTDAARNAMKGQGANIQNLNQQILADVDVMIPPINIQDDYLAFVQQVDKSKIAVQRIIEKLSEWKDALSQKYFAVPGFC